MMKYVQCHLRKPLKNSTLYTTTYIPEKYAKVNKEVKLRNNDGTWDTGWIVVSIGAQVDEKAMPDVHKRIKRHRRDTGDSLLK